MILEWVKIGFALMHCSSRTSASHRLYKTWEQTNRVTKKDFSKAIVPFVSSLNQRYILFSNVNQLMCEARNHSVIDKY